MKGTELKVVRQFYKQYSRAMAVLKNQALLLTYLFCEDEKKSTIELFFYTYR